MNLETLVAELVKALAWPVATIVLAVLFRRPLVTLVDGLRLRRLKGKDWEAEFIEVREAVAGAKEELPTAKEPARLPAPENLDALLRSDPSAAIVAALPLLDRTLITAAEKAGVRADGRFSTTKLAEQLEREGVLKPGTLRSITGLQHLRNLVVHGDPVSRESLSPERAREFVTMVNAIAFAIDQNVSDYLEKKK